MLVTIEVTRHNHPGDLDETIVQLQQDLSTEELRRVAQACVDRMEQHALAQRERLYAPSMEYLLG